MGCQVFIVSGQLPDCMELEQGVAVVSLRMNIIYKISRRANAHGLGHDLMVKM